MVKFERILSLAMLILALTQPARGQTAEESDELLPCVAAVDIGGPSAAELTASWVSFRTNWPTRPFCLLRLEGASELFVPAPMSRDPRTIIANINRDGDDEFKQSDWFDLCNLRSSSIKEVALLVDISLPVIERSLEYFMEMLMDNGFVVPPRMAAPQDDNNYIEPFNELFLSSNMPSVGPTGIPSVSPSVSPSLAPSNLPSVSPSALPTRLPSRSPSDLPSLSPSNRPSALPSFSPSDLPSVSPSSQPTDISGTPASMELSMKMEFPATNGIIINNALTDAELDSLDAALETFYNDNFGSVLSGFQFIGTSATNTFSSQPYDGVVTINYISTVSAVFRNSAITSADFVAAADMLSDIPLMFGIYSIGGNFVELVPSSFSATYVTV